MQFKIHVEERTCRVGVYLVEAENEEDALYEFDSDYNSDLNTDWDAPDVSFYHTGIEVTK